MKRIILLITLPLFLSFVCFPSLSTAEETMVKSTIENLQQAFQGESNANARYLAFAAKADEEGYAQAASLFRAAAKSEEIHAKNHQKVIVKMGWTVNAQLAKPEVKSTLENLQAALQGETAEKDQMYPAFIKQAESDGNKEAVRSFTWAMKAESEHAKLYAEAAGNLSSWKSGKRTFLVCTRCGFTALPQTLNKCPVCSEPRKEIIEVS